MPASITARRAAARRAGDAGRGQLYDTDGWTWSVEQAEALRQRDFDTIDWDNVIEEIEDVGRSEKRAWVSNCARAVEHMLAIEHYGAADAALLRRWAGEVATFRTSMAIRIRRNPGLQGHYEEMFEDAWEQGRQYAVSRLARYTEPREGSGLARKALRGDWDAVIPDECPYRIEDVTAFDLRTDKRPARDVWPPGVARLLNERLGESYPVRGVASRGGGRGR